MTVIDVIRLLLFPALMAFAASSDLLTMTISNRLSLALAAGFFAVTLIIGISASLYTALVVTRLIYDYFTSTRRLQTLSI